MIEDSFNNDKQHKKHKKKHQLEYPSLISSKLKNPKKNPPSNNDFNPNSNSLYNNNNNNTAVLNDMFLNLYPENNFKTPTSQGQNKPCNGINQSKKSADKIVDLFHKTSSSTLQDIFTFGIGGNGDKIKDESKTFLKKKK